MIRELIKPNEKYIHISIPEEYLNEELEVIIFKTDEPIIKSSKNEISLKEFDKLSENISTISEDVDILKLDESMNSDIF
ncbi:MAG: hypothetical protein U9N02_09365 [Campylobacterota bacterium]|nr:hypothetical protein [Campylobacterota bacterium]